MTFEFTEEEQRIAKGAAKKVMPFGYLGFDDYHSIALTTIWKNRDSYDPDKYASYPTYIYTKVKCAIYDEIRSMNGRAGSAKYEAKHSEFQPETCIRSTQGADQTVGVLAVEDIVAKMDYREQYIIQGIVSGMLKQDIAENLNLTPGRISQLLGSAKEKIQRELEYVD